MTDKQTVYENLASLPRLGKGKFSKILITKELWEMAVKENPEFKDMSYKEFQDVWEMIATGFKNTVLENPLGIKAPFFIGEWKIQYLPFKHDVTDHKSSEEIGEKVGFLNLHSNGKNGALVWERKGARRYNRMLDLYAFEPLQQGFRDEVSSELMKNPGKFRVSKPRLGNKSKRNGPNN